MADIPVGLTQLMHINALSADLALSLSSSRELASLPSAPWSHQTFAHYADARRRTAPPPEPDIDDLPSSRPPPLALPRRDAADRRRARQQAAATARSHRVMSEAHSSSSTVTSHSNSNSNCNLRGRDEDEDLPKELFALLRKKGRKTRMPVRRMFVLRDGTLYNFKTCKAKTASWKLALAGAVVGLDPRTLRIVVLLNGERTLVLYAETAEQASVWTEALARAADVDGGGSRCSRGSSAAWETDNIAEIRTMSSFVDDEEGPYGEYSVPVQDVGGGGGGGGDDDVPENENWDSFRSFAKLHIRTGRGTDAMRERLRMGLAQQHKHQESSFAAEGV